MPLSELPGLRPSRDFDELIAMSMRRGRRLRLRRRTLQSVPAAVAAVVAIAIPVSGVLATGHDGLARLKTTDIQPAKPDHGPAGTDASPSAVKEPAGAAGALSGPGPASPTAVPQVLPSATQLLTHGGASYAHETVSFADAKGDATATSTAGAPAAPAGSDPSVDITQMRFRSTSAGIEVTMWLAGAYRGDGVYLASLTDKSSGCTLHIVLGGPVQDSASVVCATGSPTALGITNTQDPSYTQLVAVVPWKMLPSRTSPRDEFASLTGETQLTSQGAANSPDLDKATTSQTFGPFTKGQS